MIKNVTPIRTVKVSKPHLRSNDSLRSSSASHEYSSDYASNFSLPISYLGYETPPSRISTPHMNMNNDHEMTLPERPPAAAVQPVQNLYRSNTISPPTPGYDDTPYIRFALEQITFDEEVMGPRRDSVLDNSPTSNTVRSYSLYNPNDPSRVGLSDRPNRPPESFTFPSSTPNQARSAGKDQVLVPVEPLHDGSWPRLGYVPVSLRFWNLSFLIILCLLMIAGIIFCNVHTVRSRGLYNYNGSATGQYFVFQYLPQLLGMIVILWLFVVQAAMYRVLPYFSMSKELDYETLLQDTPILTANFVLPDLRFFEMGEPVVGAILLVFWLMNFTIPMLSCLYQTQYFTDAQPARWRWTTVQGLGWFLVAWYFLLILAVVCCMIRFRQRASALLWDPSSIADTIMLFQRSNILTDYARSEVEQDLESFIRPRYLRLGFWMPSGTHDICHTVGQVNHPLNRLSLEGEKVKSHKAHGKSDSTVSFDFERHRYSHGSEFTRNIHSPFQRYRWCPWFLRDSALLAWIIAAVLLLLAFLVVSFVNRAVQVGFDPMLPSATLSNGFSSSNFLYSFLPSVIGTWLFLFWQPIETYFKIIQPYANLASPQGATAHQSLLQSYAAMPSFLATIHATLNKDFKLAYISAISLLSAIIPVLAGGVFTAQLFSSGDVRMVASMPGYTAMCIFLSIYALSYMVVWPTRKRYLPHSVNTIAGQLSFLYASPLLNDPAIRNVKSKADLASRLSGDGYLAPSDFDEKGLTGEGRKKVYERKHKLIDREPKYAFGIYIGRDGKEHLGIDRLQRPGSGEMLVTTGEIHQSRSFRSIKTKYDSQ